jgi:hypothetical protein
MMEARPLELRFKGERDYLHGTDIYDAVASALRQREGRADGAFRMSIHRIARRQCAMVVADTPDRAGRPEEAVVEFALGGGGSRLTGWLIETEYEVDCRYSYDEDAVVADTRFDGEAIILDRAPGYRPIEVVVAMTKRLHYSAVPIAAGRWMFTRLDLKRLLEDEDEADMRIELKNRLGHRLTRSRIECRGVHIGEIYFSAVRP